MYIPQHVAIILDGNGRWAKSKGMPRSYGHVMGAKNLERIAEDASDIGIKYLTVYLFSTENWKRSKDEVDALMKLFGSYAKTCLKLAKDNNMRVRVLGDPSAFAPNLQKALKDVEESSKDYTGLNLNLALNYGSRDEIRRAVSQIVSEAVEGTLDPTGVTEDTISSHLDTADIPDPDLMIRTSGEMRLSNFLMWQLAYAEFIFTDVPWPAFTKQDLLKCIEHYNSRDRRYGGVKEA